MKFANVMFYGRLPPLPSVYVVCLVAYWHIAVETSRDVRTTMSRNSGMHACWRMEGSYSWSDVSVLSFCCMLWFRRYRRIVDHIVHPNRISLVL